MIPISEALAKANGTLSKRHTSYGVATLLPEENKFLDSLGAPKLKNCANDVLIAALRHGMMLVGIRGDRMPIDAEIASMLVILRDNNGGLTIKELKLAFEMAVERKLDFDPNTYQNFSVLYLSDLLIAYKAWSTQTYDTLRPGGDPESEKEKPDYSYYSHRILSENQVRGEIETGYRNFLRGIMTNYLYVPYEWFNTLVRDGFIDQLSDVKSKRVDQLSNFDKSELGREQRLVFDLFELAKARNYKNIYVPA